MILNRLVRNTDNEKNVEPYHRTIRIFQNIQLAVDHVYSSITMTFLTLVIFVYANFFEKSKIVELKEIQLFCSSQTKINNILSFFRIFILFYQA